MSEQQASTTAPGASTSPLMTVQSVSRRFGGGRNWLGRRRAQVHALSAIDLEVMRGETLGVVGESGCGKSTLARIMVGLDQPSDGTINFDGQALGALGRERSRRIQYVFQDPVASLNPRNTIRETLAAPLTHLLGLSGPAREARLAELLESVRLAPRFMDRYPHEFSGGQAQRIAIARALAARPELLVLDEPVSALDVSVQAQVLQLLGQLRTELALTYVFISHDLAVVESLCDRVAVLYFGRVAEIGSARDVFTRPRHPYTHLLLRSAPAPGRSLAVDEDTESELPDPLAPPAGCAFAARCPRATERCRTERPELSSPDNPAHRSACHHPFEEPVRFDHE